MPPTALPVVRSKAPEEPDAAEPLFTSITPLAPTAPFAELMTSFPLELSDPEPVVIVTSPPVPAPVAASLSPALSSSLPPNVVSPLPTAIVMSPPLPPVAMPLLSDTAPDTPASLVPVLIVIAPLTPVAPALTDAIVT